MMVSHTPENELGVHLLARIHCGDAGALAHLYDLWVHEVYSIGVHLLGDPAAAEEAVERTFSQIWSEAGQYHSARGTVSAWIVLIARGQSLPPRRGGPGRARDELRPGEELVHRAASRPPREPRSARAQVPDVR